MTAPDCELSPKPVFGEWLRGIYASETNPQRDGMYVRTIRRAGKLNPGVYYECTDGKGKFWQYPAQSVERIHGRADHATEKAAPDLRERLLEVLALLGAEAERDALRKFIAGCRSAAAEGVPLDFH